MITPIPCRHASLAGALAAAMSVAASAAQVQEAWVDRLNGPASMNDYGNAVAFGPDGSVYVAGSIFEHVRDNLFAPRFLTMRFDAGGGRLWSRTYAGTFASGAAAAGHIAIDTDGNVLVSGSTNQGHDWAVLKYDPDGTEQWRTVYEADSRFLTQPDDMAVDASGNVYLVGFVGDFVNPNAGALVKVTSEGVLEWARRYYGPSFDGASFGAVAVDDAGNVYAAGSALVPDRASELCVVKYDGAGGEQWLATDGSPGRFTHDRATDIAVDGNGDILVAGAFGSNSSGGIDLATAKFDAGGAGLWRRLYAGPAGRTDAATMLAVDSANNVVVVGYSGVTSFDEDALTLKYDAAGTLLWEQRVAGDESFPDRANAVAIDGQDNIYVTGEYDPIGGSRFFTVRYDPGGGEQWFMSYAGPLGGGSRATAVAVHPDHGVCVTGESPGAGTDFDITTILYTQPPDRLPGDVDGDGVVSFADLLAVLAAWGPCDKDCPEDLDGDGLVGFSDLLIVLANWS